MEIRWWKPSQRVFWEPGSLLVKGPNSGSSFCYYDGDKVTDFVYGNSTIKDIFNSKAFKYSLSQNWTDKTINFKLYIINIL